MTKQLENEFSYYLKNQSELVKRYAGKFLVIKGIDILGVYDSDMEALEKTVKDHELGTFLIQFCSPGESDYTHTYHSRIAFV